MRKISIFLVLALLVTGLFAPFALAMPNSATLTGTPTKLSDHRPSEILGDLNGDGKVDNTDLQMLLNEYWGPCTTGSPCIADFNGDGFVNSADLAILLGAWTDDESDQGTIGGEEEAPAEPSRPFVVGPASISDVSTVSGFGEEAVTEDVDEVRESNGDSLSFPIKAVYFVGTTSDGTLVRGHVIGKTKASVSDEKITSKHSVYRGRIAFIENGEDSTQAGSENEVNRDRYRIFGKDLSALNVVSLERKSLTVTDAADVRVAVTEIRDSEGTLSLDFAKHRGKLELTSGEIVDFKILDINRKVITPADVRKDSVTESANPLQRFREFFSKEKVTEEEPEQGTEALTGAEAPELPRPERPSIIDWFRNVFSSRGNSAKLAN